MLPAEMQQILQHGSSVEKRRVRDQLTKLICERYQQYYPPPFRAITLQPGMLDAYQEPLCVVCGVPVYAADFACHADNASLGNLLWFRYCSLRYLLEACHV